MPCSFQSSFVSGTAPVAVRAGLLWRISRLPLYLVPTHPDRAAGLGFLGGAHLALAIFPFAFSCVLSAHVAFQVHFEAMPRPSGEAWPAYNSAFPITLSKGVAHWPIGISSTRSPTV